ncbi:serine/threonine specific protein phosphatase [Mycobacteroides abscessus subsp. abscessus]|uniref:metallophosphoesterase n=1 Tax=Mycobacteroides abscessus TaxID=36809 RepID=UPI0009284824|nr:metallophosphoesterase [Mycobacteroides abscessus]SIG30645.1 serine/threonine specific protein phosphatase [Mycobacteroides abscessus subsp. abscessus]SIH56095.1 serine/threonine specific protein phosphatase [Mycobacteroides abscessus subsp. abscessus]SKW04747.1 serine/threonine specific protein phosphatase [Mycobacteroides abscessus subsp. abscessus]
MTTVWFVSDLHIGHALVAVIRAERAGIALPANPVDRQLAAIEWHDQTLAEKWDAIVHPGDQVWDLGDNSSGTNTAQMKSLAWLYQRPGEKHLVPGNHDRCHPMYRDAHKWQRDYLQVFQSVQPFARRRIGGRTVLMSHLPYLGDHTTAERYNQYRLRDEGAWLLHGHTHSTASYLPYVHQRQLHVGVDAWNLAPVGIDTLAEGIEFLERGDAS